MEGVLEEFGLADILQLIYFQKKSGVLNVIGNKDTVKINLINGNISGVESKRKLGDFKLGSILVKKGLITSDNLNVALEIQKEEKIKLGIVFLRRGLVSEEVLQAAIKERITEAIANIFAWKEGRYEFIAQDISPDTELPVSIDTQHLLMDGLRTVDEWSLIEGKLDLDTTFELRKEPEPGQLDETEMAVFNLIDGVSDVSTIISVSPSGDFDTSKALISLEEKGIIAPAVIDLYKELREEEVVQVSVSEKPFIITTLIIAAIVLIVALKGVFDTFRALSHVRADSKIERLKEKTDIYFIEKGRYPDEKEIIGEEEDSWGRPYIYRLSKDGFSLFSMGQDGIEGTDDDVY
ncbi:MAG: DUF4388 domain-containing protein [Nitrospirae bacterium]|nr:DUF4388 domain-containing protein [Nitrospirota bacterium]